MVKYKQNTIGSLAKLRENVLLITPQDCCLAFAELSLFKFKYISPNIPQSALRMESMMKTSFELNFLLTCSEDWI